MSYSSIRKRTQEVVPQEPDGPAKCGAIGCKVIASVNTGGKWCCTSHAFSESERWPAITDGLREHDWLVNFTAEIQSMDRQCKDWRGFAVQFWDGQDDYCKPDPREEAIPYFNRMKGELDYRLGLMKRPAPRIPQQPTSRGNAARFLGGRA